MSYQSYQPRTSAPARKTASWAGFWQTLRQIGDGQKNIGLPGSRRLLAVTDSTGIIRKHRPDYLVMLFMGLLMLVGLVVMFATSPQIINAANNARNTSSDQYFYFTKQVVSVFVGLVGFVAMLKIPLEFWQKHLKWLLLGAFGLSAVLFLLSQVKPEMVCSLGACRWLRFGFFSIQVSEIVKFNLLIFFAFFWAYMAKQKMLDDRRNIIYSVGLILSSLAVIVVLQKDLGTGISMALFLLFMMLIAGFKLRLVIGFVVVLLVGGVLGVLSQPYRLARVRTFLEGSDATMTNANRHIIEANIALGSGGFFGLGVGNSIQSTGYLPEVINDSVFAIIGEVFGFIGAMVVIFLFVGLLWRLLRGVIYSHNLAYRLVFAGVCGWIFAHLFINIASMTGITPMTGITLPFVSYGGSSLLLASMVLGLAFNLSAYTAHTPYFETVGERKYVRKKS